MPARLYATGSKRGAEFFRQYGDVDTSAAIVTFADGALGVVSNTRYNGRGYDVRLEVHGSKDSVAAGVDDKWPMRSLEPDANFRHSGQPFSSRRAERPVSRNRRTAS